MILHVFYAFLVVICIVPIAPGLIGVLSSSLSYIPSIGLTQFTLNGYHAAFEWSGVWHSILLTLSSAIISTFFTCIISFAILQSGWYRPIWKKIEPLLAPLLAMPHVAFAIGFAFLFSPTGMIARLIAPITNEPLFSIINDPFNIGLILVLIIKEVPFLLLMSIPIMQQLNIDKTIKVTTSLGYKPHQMWWKCLFPQWLKKARFPLLAIIAYSVSVVDVGLIIGSSNPPTFAVLVWQWFSDPDINLQPRAGAGAVILFILCLLLIAIHRFIEWGITSYCRAWQISGRFGFVFPGLSLFGMVSSIIVISFPIMWVWSIAQRWRFPNLTPTQFSLRFWIEEWPNIVPTIADSLFIALISASIALVLALIGHEYRLKYRWHIPPLLIAIPMLVPQLSLLFGIQVAALYFSHDSYYIWVIWSHIFFSFPYIFLALDGPWRSFDQRLIQTGLSLGKSPLHCWFTIKAPLLFPAIIYAGAIGISVSLAQYLPTKMLGAGRVMTLTTEAVALSSGFDRRITALYALWQALLPFVFFTLAVVIGRYYSRHSHINIKTRKVEGHEPINKESHHFHS